ncbi:MAG: acyl-CoA dehydrogenase, partial [Pseudomonadota bacterium]|nr:acyl-CoA dehydrogenase [Pseudomonadota bacterium]
KEYGGHDFSAYAQSQIVMKIATRSINVAVVVMVPNSLGPGELLLHFGTQDQRDQYLPKLATAEEIPAFGLTGPNAGSDAGSVPDFGIVCKKEIDGKEVIGFRTTWEKRYITLGPICTVLGLAFRAYDPDGILGDNEDLGITCALVPTDTDGVFIGHRHMPLNASFPNGPNAGKDVFIPMDWVIGKEEGVGKGWRMLMSCLGVGRSISLPALGTASGKMGSAILGLYTRTRRQFNTSISNFEGIKEAMGRVAGLTYMIDAGRIMTAHCIDRGENPTVISAILKMHNTDSMRTILEDTMDILGGKAICMGPNNPFARAWQYAPIGITVEGANILTRSLMIFGQGAIRCHPYVLAEMQSAYEEDYKKGEAAFDKAFSGHVSLIFKNMTRSVYLGLSSNLFLKAPVNDQSAKYYKDFTRLSTNFTFTADLCMGILGGELKKKEAISGRLGDCLSFLYYGSAVLKKWRDDGSRKEDWPIAQWALDYCSFRIQKSLNEVYDNFPTPGVGFVLKKICFPFGTKFTYPGDDVTFKASDILANPEMDETVRRLTDGAYITDDPNDQTGGGAFIAARDAVVKAEPIIKKYKKATGNAYNSVLDTTQLEQAIEEGVLTVEEGQILREAAEASRKVIAVDSFSPEAAKAGWVEADEFDTVFNKAIVLNEGSTAAKKGKSKAS